MFEIFLNSMQTEIKSKIIDLNHGGCGYFAYYCTKKLRQKGILAVINMKDYDEKSFHKRIEMNRSIRKNNSPKSCYHISAHHFTIQIYGKK